MFYTYIIYASSIDKFYIGASNNPEQRLQKHNNKNKGFTNRACDWKIVFLKKFDTFNEALAFEMKIKSWKSKVKINKLILSAENALNDIP